MRGRLPGAGAMKVEPTGLPGSLAAACALTTCQAFPLLASVGSRRPRAHGEVEGVLGEENLAKKESDFF